jgi:hypothetical protein
VAGSVGHPPPPVALVARCETNVVYGAETAFVRVYAEPARSS